MFLLFYLVAGASFFFKVVGASGWRPATTSRARDGDDAVCRDESFSSDEWCRARPKRDKNIKEQEGLLNARVLGLVRKNKNYNNDGAGVWGSLCCGEKENDDLIEIVPVSRSPSRSSSWTSSTRSSNTDSSECSSPDTKINRVDEFSSSSSSSEEDVEQTGVDVFNNFQKPFIISSTRGLILEKEEEQVLSPHVTKKNVRVFHNIKNSGEKYVVKVFERFEDFEREKNLKLGENLKDIEEIIQCRDTVWTGQHPGLVFEYFDGEPLTTVVEAFPLTESQVASVMYQILEALDALHKKGLVFGDDFTPENILITKKYREDRWDGVLNCSTNIKITATVKKAKKTSCGIICPSCCFGLSEDENSCAGGDEKSDMWNAGLIGHFLLTGRSLDDEKKNSCWQRTLLPLQCEWEDNTDNESNVVISNEARDFVGRLLTRNRYLRPSAETAMEDPFFFCDERKFAKADVKQRFFVEGCEVLIPGGGKLDYVKHLGRGATGVVGLFKKSTGPENDEEGRRENEKVVVVKGFNELEEFEPERKIYMDVLGECADDNIIKCHDAVVVGEKRGLILEHFDGENLGGVMDDFPFTESEVADIMRQLLLVVRKLHEDYHLVHRDLTPNNIMITRKCREDKEKNEEMKNCSTHVKVIDFGDAKVCHAGRGLTRQPLCTSCGTSGYQAPELLANGAYYGVEPDMWSLGMLCYQLLTRRLPSWAENVEVLKRWHWHPEEMDDELIFEWNDEQVSPIARNFVEQMLVHQQDRPEARRMLEHDFIKQKVLEGGVTWPRKRTSSRKSSWW